ncbi:MAG TPA: glycogen debranching N-terminal domain-containing protein [Thermomicrobiales bacterium]|nr:glycogen debranching N-terminal domain-containing protein [Thermomicrobiales bacterium]
MALVDDHVVLKNGELYVVCGRDGDIRADARNDGLYFRDMRHLRQMRLAIDGWPLDLLSDSANAIDRQTLYLTNATGGTHFEAVARSLAIIRERSLDGALVERVSFTNHSRDTLSLTVRMELASDFRDAFDIRGFAAADEPPSVRAKAVGNRFDLQRDTPDGFHYRTCIVATPPPTGATVPTRSEGTPEARIELAHVFKLAPGASSTIEYRVAPEVIDGADERQTPIRLAPVDGSGRRGSSHFTSITTSNSVFDSVLHRSLDDLSGLVTPLPGGQTIVAAGLPWYVAPFGRDSLIVGRQLLPFNPDFLAGALRFLASVQGERDDPSRDEQPGRIVHEVRFGDLSRRGVIPFSRYYGTVDATPLFLLMLTEYLDWTGDDALFDELRPNVERALDWIATSGDSNGDGLVDYQRRAGGGLSNQGWKDSHDSLEHVDGTPVTGPIALIEVQGYVYAARAGLARHLERRGEHERAATLRSAAERLREQINDRFWMPEHDYYAEALDGDGRQLAGIASNPAHLLACGVPDERQAAAIVARVFAPDMFSGWGIRTLSASMPHYNPVSYHRGSVWPHDNGFALWGLRRNFAVQPLERLTTALFDAAARVPHQRLPELISGFSREGRPSEIPIAYPISCSPQAWAAGVPLVMVETLLGLRAGAAHRSLFLAPHLPAWLDCVELRGLRVADASLDLRITRDGDRTQVEVLANDGGIAVVSA